MSDRHDLELDEGFAGLLVVGDIHGNSDLMDRMLEHARRERLFFISCGDLVDRGPDNAGCLLRMRDCVNSGRGMWVRGNHENKLYRALKRRSVRITPPLAATLAELTASADGMAARSWFLKAFDLSPFAIRRGSLFIVHGGFGVRMLDLDPLPRPLRIRALYGQLSGEREADGKPRRLYRWVDEVPVGLTVVIGHDPCCDFCLLEREGKRGGRLIHLDSAAGKGGPLSAIQTDGHGVIERALQARRESSEMVEIDILPFSPGLARSPGSDPFPD